MVKKNVPVINIRGTNGSGKSYLIKEWMKQVGSVPYPRRNNLFGGDTLISMPQYYVLGDGGIVIGPYEADCGGCDRMPTTQDVRNAVDAARLRSPSPRYVIFEGVIISTVFESWLQYSRSIGGMYWVYLDTPEEVCLKRVAERNQGAEINQQLIRDKIKSVLSTRKKALANGQHVTTLRWEHAFKDFKTFMSQEFYK